MRTLFISPVVPAADGIGTEKRAHTHLEALLNLGEVDVVLTIPESQLPRLGHLEELRARCPNLWILPLQLHRKLKSYPLPGLRLLSRFFYILANKQTIPPESLEVLRRCIGSVIYDFVFCFRIRTYPIFEELKKVRKLSDIPLFVDFDDIESQALSRELPFSARRIGVEMTLVSRLDCMETAFLERRILKSANMVSVCSEIDKAKLLKKRGSARISVVPNSFSPNQPIPPCTSNSKHNILFVGTLNYAPNEDAILYFIEDILPLIQSRLENEVIVSIVGRRPSTRMQSLNEEHGVTLKADVESVEPYYAASDIVIAPIRFGGGTRIKILEALAYGRPVVSTTIGAEGLSLDPSRDLMIADDPSAFAEACVHLLLNPELRVSLAESGRKQVVASYAREHVVRGMMDTIQPLLKTLSKRAEA